MDHSLKECSLFSFIVKLFPTFCFRIKVLLATKGSRKKNLFLVARPLKGGGGEGKGRATKRNKNFFLNVFLKFLKLYCQ